MEYSKIYFNFNENSRKNIKNTSISKFTPELIKKARRYHKSFPEYQVTPLYELNDLADRFQVNKIWVKDESYRFNLNAFKVLGGSYAIGKYLAEKCDIDEAELTYDMLCSQQIQEKLGDITFVTATDGNHGLGIAWIARKLGQKAVVFMPKTAAEPRVRSIENEGATVYVTNSNYDDSVKLAFQYAQDNNGIVVQDTAWEGYEEIPTWIMQGYGTIIDEVIEQIDELGENIPTHVFLQGGVGSFAGSIQAYLTARFGNQRPLTVIVEPDKADCLFKSSQSNGEPISVNGDLDTIMAGLACGEPNIVSWDVLKDYADVFVSCPDNVAARGVRILGNPLPGDPQIISGESGAVGLGVLSLIQEKQEFNDLKRAIKLDDQSKILIISTEGDTDPYNYRKIVWDGLYSF